MIFRLIFAYLIALKVLGLTSFKIQSHKKRLEDFSIPIYTTGLTSVILNYTSHMLKSKQSINFMQVSHPNNMIDHLYIMNEVLYHAHRKGGVYRIVHDVEKLSEFSKKLKKSKRFHTILLVDSLDSFYEFFKYVDLEYWDVSGYFVVALTQPEEEIYEFMENIFKAFWSKYIVNVIFMFAPYASHTECIVYTYYPYSRSHCSNAIPIKLNHYRHNTFLMPIDYFPKKMKNFHGCYVTIVTFINPPFMFFEKGHDGKFYLDGIEGNMVIALKHALQLNLRMYVEPERQGRVFKNGTITGAMKMLHDGKANMSLGFFASLPIRERFLTSSFVYYSTDLVWLVPPGKPINAIEKLLNPLDESIWTLFSFSLIIGFIVIFVVKIASKEVQNFIFGRRTLSPAMNLINITLGNSLHQLPFRNFSRFLVIIYTFYCFIIRSSYLGGLVKFMQMDTREPIMKSTKELLNNNFSLYFFDADVTYLSEVKHQHGYIVTPAGYDQKLSKISDPYFKGALLASKSFLAYNNRLNYPDFTNHAPEPVYTLNLVIYMQKNSCLKRAIDSVFINLVASGLIDKWVSDYIDDKYLKEPPQDSVQVLNLKQLEGAFKLLGFGLGAAFCIFWIEIFIDKVFLKLVRKFRKN